MSPRHNAANERIKRKYLTFLKEAKGLAEGSIDQVAAALARFEESSRYRDFGSFHIEQARAFKRKLLASKNLETAKPLSKATAHSTLRAIKAFFEWLSREQGFKSKIAFSDAAYFNLTENDTRIARVTDEVAYPSLEQVHHVLTLMPANSDIERRDRAVFALILLTGARDHAVISLKVRHLDLAQGRLVQDPRDEVATKRRKSITTYFMPVGDEPLAIVTDWKRYLIEDLLFGPGDPLFPKTQVAPGADLKFEPTGLDRAPWRGATPVRQIFKEAFALAGQPYYHPHSFRHTLVKLGGRLCRTPEEFKAWSQNMGHDQVMTTLTSYGAVALGRQAEIIKGLAPRELDTRLLSQADAENLLKNVQRLVEGAATPISR